MLVQFFFFNNKGLSATDKRDLQRFSCCKKDVGVGVGGLIHVSTDRLFPFEPSWRQ